MADYLDGELPLDSRALFDAHLDQCSPCSTELAEMRDTIRMLRTLPYPEPPESFVADVMKRIDEGEGQADWFGRLLEQLSQIFVPRFAIPATAVAAALTLTFMTGDLNLRTLDPTSRPGQLEVAGFALDSQSAAQGRASQLRERVQVPVRVVANRMDQGSSLPTARAETMRVARAQQWLGQGLAAPNRDASAGSFLFRISSDQLGPMRRQPRETDFAGRMMLMNGFSQGVGPYLGASAAPPMSLGATSTTLRTGARGQNLQPVAVSRTAATFGADAGADDSAFSPEERRNQELDARLAFLIQDPTGFAMRQAETSLAARELWLQQLAARAEELGEVERVMSALEGSGDRNSLNLARDFDTALKQNRASWASAEAKPEGK
ncbi:MAG: hypothetical protein ACI9QQ_000041 [Myxococcota bacterium]|jgi:hypothetical protein